MDAKLGNAEFVKKAPEEVVEELRERREDAATSATKLKQALKQIGGAA
jgi:valyl-tRNA synthetase